MPTRTSGAGLAKNRYTAGLDEPALVLAFDRLQANIWYVDADNGSGGGGRDWAGAFPTIEEAYDAAAAEDLILVAPGSYAVTETLVLDKHGLTIMASPQGMAEAGESTSIVADSSFTDGPVITIKAPCRLVGLHIAGRSLTEESLLIDCEEQGGFEGGFNLIERCRFPAAYGAIDHAIRILGGTLNFIVDCTFDGLFVGFDESAIVLEDDAGGITCDFVRVIGCTFSGIGSSIPAILCTSGDTPLDLLVAHNYLTPGFLGNAGILIDFNSTATTGLAADNWVAPLANQGAAFTNTGSLAQFGFADNHYEEV